MPSPSTVAPEGLVHRLSPTPLLMVATLCTGPTREPVAGMAQ
ncbi:hypothetical protein [Amycolatopsis thermophila]|uniref:Uncharacterized protein n=1 Tax=Amycolatopsis thermophila TaxID=206084 RepID=A0ABU0EZV3_9PSEU|nr:hypothetical protein [Amycolatopsis thermophila]MDQ0380332.1 hypothetical protein [Amycolatopsis thermophila]